MKQRDMKMKQQKLKSKDKQSSVTVMCHNNRKIATNKQCFVSVIKHPMHLSKLSMDYIRDYYVVPDDLDPS